MTRSGVEGKTHGAAKRVPGAATTQHGNLPAKLEHWLSNHMHDHGGMISRIAAKAAFPVATYLSTHHDRVPCQVNHENIVRVREVFDTPNTLYMVRGVLQGRFLRINGWSRAIARWHLPGAPVPCARTPCDSGRGTPSCYHAWALMARAAALSHDVSRNVLRLIR